MSSGQAGAFRKPIKLAGVMIFLLEFRPIPHPIGGALSRRRRFDVSLLARQPMSMTKITYAGYRFPPEIIQQAIWLDLRFTPSFGDVEDWLAERGIATSWETVRRRAHRFGPIIAADLRKRRPKPRTTRRLDEAYLKIDGRMVCLWRAVDAQGEVLDVLVQSKRNKHARLKLMRKLLKKYVFVARRSVTDDLRSYRGARLVATTRSLRAVGNAPGGQFMRDLRRSNRAMPAILPARQPNRTGREVLTLSIAA